jgi:nicotinamidase-related amidase
MLCCWSRTLRPCLQIRSPDDIVITKTTDSARTGTNLRLILSNMGIENVVVGGIFTDQCA